MVNLTVTEKKVLNNMSIEHSPSVKLGDEIDAIIDGINAVVVPPAIIPEPPIVAGTPVNAVSATATLAITGVVIHGEVVNIGDDTYEFAADALQTVTRPEFIPVDIEASTTKATGTLTMDTQPMSGDTVTIGTKVYTFVPIGTDTADGEVTRGLDLAAAKAALVASINGTDTISDPHPLVSAAEFVGDTCAITALVGGAAGNLIATTETFTAGTNSFAAVALATGADCTAANAITALVAAITASDTVGVGAVDGAGDTVVLTADVAGVSGNAIPIAKTMANGAFNGAPDTLLGGVDGTVADPLTMLADATYLYFTVVANTVAGKNWRRVALGSAY